MAISSDVTAVVAVGEKFRNESREIATYEILKTATELVNKTVDSASADGRIMLATLLTAAAHKLNIGHTSYQQLIDASMKLDPPRK